MIINGKEIKFSPTNKRDASNMEKALKEMQQTEKKIQQMKEDGATSLLEVLDAMINMVKQFFISATGVDVVGDCEEATEAIDMYMQFLGEVAKGKNKLMNSFNPKRVK